MDQAKEAVAKFTGRQGHTTEVDERVQAPVTNESVKPTRYEESTQAVDREVHKDHYHTTVQPIEHREVLPEKHTHNIAPVQEREFRHDDERETQQRVQGEAAKFKDSSRTHATSHSQAQAANVTGEHVHHHVHETVQPVINKEVIRPETVHTTVPIHETHHADAQFHGQSVLPTKTMDEVKGLGQTTRHEQYAGVPKQYNKEMQLNQTDSDRLPGQTGVDGPGSHNLGGTGLSRTDKFVDPHGHTSTSGRSEPSRQDGYDSSNQKKPSLMDKMNPKVDSDGDGKAGFMS